MGLEVTPAGDELDGDRRRKRRPEGAVRGLGWDAGWQFLLASELVFGPCAA